MSTLGSALLAPTSGSPPFYGNPLIISSNMQPNFPFGTAFAVGLICTVSSGASLTYKVQITGDASPSPTGNWNDHDVLSPVNAAWTGTVSANGNIAIPVNAVRLVFTAYSSGSVNLAVTVWGPAS